MIPICLVGPPPTAHEYLVIFVKFKLYGYLKE